MRTHTTYLVLAHTALLLAASVAAARPQNPGPGPIAAPPKFEVKRMPEEAPEAPAIPANEIIRRFTANEDKRNRPMTTRRSRRRCGSRS